MLFYLNAKHLFMSNYYIKFGISRNNNAGSKAMRDIMSLLDAKGYKAVLSLPTSANKIFKLIDIPILLLTSLFKVRRKGIIIYFIPSNFQRIRFLNFLKQIIGFKLICFINDIESMRMHKNKEYTTIEIKSISYADIVLVPNENSIYILQNEFGIANHLIPVGVWDYLSNYKHESSESDIVNSFHKQIIVFAGNLNKAPFLEKLPSVNLKFKIWGSGKKMANKGNIDFMGEESPNELIKYIAGCSWGLVWDGDSIYTCNGLLGTYLRFNNSHKCGLYLSAGIPVIVWQESGMASFVNNHKVGICVSSLQAAAELINHMDKESYSSYRKNAQSIAKEIKNGKFFLNALDKAEKLKIK